MAKKWVIMKGRIGEAENLGSQVYGDKFMEYDKVWHLVYWLNKHMLDTGHSYWLKELEMEK